MFRNFWNALLGRETVKPEIIRFNKDHTLSERAINVLRSAGVEEGPHWNEMVDGARIALSAYAKLDNVILSPLNVPKVPNIPIAKSEPKVTKASKTDKKLATEKKPKDVVSTNLVESKKETEKTVKSPKIAKISKPKTSKAIRKSKKTISETEVVSKEKEISKI